MLLLKFKSNHIPLVLKALLCFPCHLEKKTSPHNGLQDPATSGSVTSLISSLPTLSLAGFMPVTGPFCSSVNKPGILQSESLYICCSLCLPCSSLDIHMTHSSPPSSLCSNVNLLNYVFMENLISNRNTSPLSASLSRFPCFAFSFIPPTF